MRERHKWLLANLIALIILTLMGSAGALFFQARGGAPSTTQANEVAGEQAGRTTTAQAYPSYLSWNGTLVFFDHLDQDVGSKWDSLGASSTESCQFTGGTYHVRKEAIGSVVLCSAHGTFSNFAFEVQLTVTQGDCGGVIFRSDGNGHFYYFRICQNGMYDVSKYDNISAVTNLRRSSSSAIHAGLGQQNKIAIMASGSTMAFYINEQQIDQEQDSSYTSGSIALIAAQYSDGGNVTDVAYSNARLWTL